MRKEHSYWKLQVTGGVVVVSLKLETNRKYNS